MSKKKSDTRDKFREAVFARDNNKCKFCDKTNGLDAHHITNRSKMPGGGYILENGITLCKDHHLDAEIYHMSAGHECIEGFHPDDLYRLIGTTYEVAYAISLGRQRASSYKNTTIVRQ